MRDTRFRTPHWRRLISLTLLSAVSLISTPPVANAADGQLDPTFGNGGIVTLGWNSTTSLGPKLAIQPDGRIVVAAAPSFQLSLIRFFSDGFIDPTFATVPVPGLEPREIALQPDGKIVVVTRQGVVLRFNGNGSLDTAFGVNGRQPLVHFEGNALAIQSDGKIVVAGLEPDESDSPESLPKDDIRVVRLNTNGSFDTSFSVVQTSLGWHRATADDVLVQEDGRLVVIGQVWTPYGEAEFAVLRLHTDGSPDVSFGAGGAAISNHKGSFQFPPAGALQKDGKIVVVGPYGTPGGSDYVLTRYEADGSLDASFADHGVLRSFFAKAEGMVRAIAIQQDGKILLAGGVDAASDGLRMITEYGLMRFKATGPLDPTTGILDPTFGLSGVVRTPIGNGIWGRMADDLAIQSDGGIVVVGRSYENGAHKIVLARYRGASPEVPRTLAFYLHGDDTKFTMNETAPAPHVQLVSKGSAKWITEHVLDGRILGTFPAGATVALVLPCGIPPKTIVVATTNADGSDEQVLGQATAAQASRCTSQKVAIPVPANTTLVNRRLTLAISSTDSGSFSLPLGGVTFLRVEQFVGTSQTP